MRKNLWFLAFTILAVVIVSLASCNDPTAKHRQVLVVLKTLQNPYFQEMQRGIVDQAKTSLPGSKIDIKSGAAEGDAAGQRAILEEYARQYLRAGGESSLEGIIITPGSSGPELVPILSQFVKAGVPVVTLDTKLIATGVNLQEAYSAFRGSDNSLGGSLAGEEIRRLLPSGGKVLLLNGLDGHETAAARRDGFLGQMGGVGNYAVTQRTCNWDRNQARTTVAAMLDAGQAFDAVFAANDEMALGAFEAKRQKGITSDKMPIIGFDATEEARSAVKQKSLHATIAQNPSKMGAAGVEVLADLLAKKNVERDQMIPVQLVDK